MAGHTWKDDTLFHKIISIIAEKFGIDVDIHENLDSTTSFSFRFTVKQGHYIKVTLEEHRINEIIHFAITGTYYGTTSTKARPTTTNIDEWIYAKYREEFLKARKESKGSFAGGYKQYDPNDAKGTGNKSQWRDNFKEGMGGQSSNKYTGKKYHENYAFYYPELDLWISDKGARQPPDDITSPQYSYGFFYKQGRDDPEEWFYDERKKKWWQFNQPGSPLGRKKESSHKTYSEFFGGSKGDSEDFFKTFFGAGGGFNNEWSQADRDEFFNDPFGGNRKQQQEQSSHKGRRTGQENARKSYEQWKKEFDENMGFDQMNSKPVSGPREILGVAISGVIAEDVLKSAWRKKCFEWHPDTNSHRIVQAEEMMKKINDAYTTLKKAFNYK